MEIRKQSRFAYRFMVMTTLKEVENEHEAVKSKGQKTGTDPKQRLRGK